MKFKWLVSKACYCIDLRMGAKILSCVTFICSFFVILFCCSAISNSQTDDDDDDDNDDDATVTNTTVEVVKHFLTNTGLEDDPKTCKHYGSLEVITNRMGCF
jgi:hypothetical protein